MDSFNKIEISVPSSVFITQGDSESVRIDADMDIGNMIVTEVQNRVLRIRYKQSRYFPPENKEVKIYITVRELNGIKLSSSGKIKADDINTDFSIASDFDFIKCRQSSKYRNSAARKNSFLHCCTAGM